MRTIAVACLVLAVLGVVALLAPPAGAHPGHKVGPVCTVKQAKAHPKKCIVIKVPQGTPAAPILVLPAPSPK